MASIAQPTRFFSAALSPPIARAEWAMLLNWLLVWIVIANAGFVLLWFIGAPPRIMEIVLAGAVGLLVRRQPRWLQFTAFLATMIYSILSFMSAVFNLAITSLVHSFKFMIELNPAQSTEYMMAFGASALSSVLVWRVLRRPSGFGDHRVLIIAGMAIILLSQLDIWMSHGMRGHYRREAPAGAPFTSAVSDSGLVAVPGAQPRHLMVVMVESLGLPVGNPEMQRLLFARYRQPAVTDRFDLSMGETTYYNSTTSGEVRELCGRWGDYYDLLDRQDNGCLPARLRAQGFETSAYHSFTGDFFERATWYPNIGFQHRTFAPELRDRGSHVCGGVFPGVCDRDVPRLLAAQLKRAHRPQFVYWLTVNSHLPVPPGNNLDVEHCERISPTLAEEFPMICRQFAIWNDIDAALAREITAPDFPPTDILIVGDHMPPYFDRHHRSQFAPDRVPWLLLRWKGGEGAPGGQSAVAARSHAASAKG